MDTAIAFGQLLLGGRWQPGAGAPLTSHDPATGEVMWEGRGASQEQVSMAVRAAHDAAPAWAATAYQKRLALCERYRDLLTSHQDGLMHTLSRETGKPLWEARQEVRSMIGKLTMADSAHRERCTDRDRSINTEGSIGLTRWRPHGVSVVLGPYNFPGHLPNGHLLPALLAGNTVVFKPSEFTPAVGQTLALVFQEAGFPPGVVNLVLGDGDVGRWLVAEPDIGAVFFTGSARTGIALRRALVDRPDVLLALEMGGNNPMVVWGVDNPAIAAAHVALSAWQTAGQRCTCIRRLILPEGELGDAVLDHLVRLTTHMRVGPPSGEPEPFMGPLITPEAADRVLDAQQRLIGGGARVILKARRVSTCRAMLVPGLLDVTNMGRRLDDEIFGPLLQVARVPNWEIALHEANASRYGLAAGLLCPSRDRFLEFAARVRAGVFSWNCPTTGASGALPFGGRGLSGNHRPGGYLAADFCSVPTAMSCREQLVPPKLPPGIAAD